ncbi:DUF4113 domain-containing protein [Comamonas sp.]|uniref:DUF4113 domain-containing protein n=1 Tax=Comamonas sp. TaxID=34028 RepID=UPI00264A185F|nr:DUF4113 domain-containing protein [Comamonas sp.]
MPLELAPAPKKQIACTRSFGHPITTQPPLIEAVSEFATRATEKLRAGGLRLIYEPGYQLSKAGVMLQDLDPADVQQRDLLFEEPCRDQSKLMEAIDRVNARFGKGTVHVASTGEPEQDESGWRMRQ